MCDKFLYLGDKIRLRQDFYKMRQNSNKVRQHLFALFISLCVLVNIEQHPSEFNPGFVKVSIKVS